jgi:hypothetical protein
MISESDKPYLFNFKISKGNWTEIGYCKNADSNPKLSLKFLKDSQKQLNFITL